MASTVEIVQQAIPFDPKLLFEQGETGDNDRRRFYKELDPEVAAELRRQVADRYADRGEVAYPTDELAVRLFGSEYDAGAIALIGARPRMRRPPIDKVLGALMYAHTVEIEDPVLHRLSLGGGIDGYGSTLVDDLHYLHQLEEFIADGSVSLVAPVPDPNDERSLQDRFEELADRPEGRRAILDALPGISAMARFPKRSTPDLVGPPSQSFRANALRRQALIRSMSGSYLFGGDLLLLDRDFDQIFADLSMSFADAWLPRAEHLLCMKALATRADKEASGYVELFGSNLVDLSNIDTRDLRHLRSHGEAFALWRTHLGAALDALARRPASPAGAVAAQGILDEGAGEFRKRSRREWTRLGEAAARGLAIGAAAAVPSIPAAGVGAAAAPAIGAAADSLWATVRSFGDRRAWRSGRRLYAAFRDLDDE